MQRRKLSRGSTYGSAAIVLASLIAGTFAGFRGVLVVLLVGLVVASLVPLTAANFRGNLLSIAVRRPVALTAGARKQMDLTAVSDSDRRVSQILIFGGLLVIAVALVSGP